MQGDCIYNYLNCHCLVSLITVVPCSNLCQRVCPPVRVPVNGYRTFRGCFKLTQVRITAKPTFILCIPHMYIFQFILNVETCATLQNWQK